MVIDVSDVLGRGHFLHMVSLFPHVSCLPHPAPNTSCCWVLGTYQWCAVEQDGTASNPRMSDLGSGCPPALCASRPCSWTLGELDL